MTDSVAIAAAIDQAEEVTKAAKEFAPPLQRLLVEAAHPDRTVARLRDILAATGQFYDRGVPVRLAVDQMHGGVVVQVVTPDVLKLLAHAACQPYRVKSKNDGSIEEVDIPLGRPYASMYLEWRGEWRLPLLNGIASAPVLRDDGTIGCDPGYDKASGLWLENIPPLGQLVPDRPTRLDATNALQLVRERFKSFCFADAATRSGTAGSPDVVDINQRPGRDESAFLTALMTAICRASLDLAPAVLLRAAPMSGAGAGKGLLARCISLIAFGRDPQAVTAGPTLEELDKRIAASLMAGDPILFLDNLNGTALKSSLLASAITERPSCVRPLGSSAMVKLNSTALIILTGNGLTVSEDLARRFITVELDPRTENPEARHFSGDIHFEVASRRNELLAAALTIWRWGRHNPDIGRGLPLGSFEKWARWVRDPLLALGCVDPVQRIAEAKQVDVRRQAVAEIYAAWWEHHGSRPVRAAGLHADVVAVLDPQGRGRQYIAGQLGQLASPGTWMSGFRLTRQPAPGKWDPATYALQKTAEGENHRNHKDHGAAEAEAPTSPPEGELASAAASHPEQSAARASGAATPMPPMIPMVSGPNRETRPDDEAAQWETSF